MLAPLLAQVPATDGEVVIELTGCEDTRSAICDLVLEATGNQALAEAVYLLVGKPLRIALVVLLALLLVRLVRRGGRRIASWFITAAEKKAAVSGKELTSDERRRVEDRADTVRRVARSLMVALIWSIAILLILSELGVNLFPLVAAAGVAGLAVGLGAQALVRDYLNGLFMLAEGQLGIGDEVDLGEAVGVVEDVSLRVTTLRDIDGNLWYVPNGQIMRVGNMSQIWSRAVVDLRLPYDVEISRVKDVIQGVTAELRSDPAWSEAFLDEPQEPFVLDLGPDAVVVRVTLRVRRERLRRIERELRERVMRALEDAGLELQPPRQVVVLEAPWASSPSSAS
jgi:small conductance mechanosensitive channel